MLITISQVVNKDSLDLHEKVGKIQIFVVQANELFLIVTSLELFSWRFL